MCFHKLIGEKACLCKLSMNKVNWLNIIKTMVGLTPFKAFLPKFYIGKIAIGTPYFYPRRWVKSKDKEGYLTPVPKKVGFNFVQLGYKWKYDSIRFEWSPLISFVVFGLQIAIIFSPPNFDHYWESWLNYTLDTPEDLNTEQRVQYLIKEHPNVWTRFGKEGEEGITTDYLELTLKNKWRK